MCALKKLVIVFLIFDTKIVINFLPAIYQLNVTP